ncbi:MAG: dephospho-CoA kinase [Fibrobacter sp.]|nr:dephospho-CoA kinase [Fibrobacter sp.]
MKTIGICGKIGSGKSAVGVLLAEKGAFVLDLDVEMHSLYAKSEELRQKISERFGAVCIRNGEVDRAALASQVFKDPKSLKDLENIVYPLLQKDAENKLERAENSENPPKIAAVEGALLFKWPEFSKKLAEIWIVQSPDDVRLERLQKRGLSKEDALRRMQIQALDPLPPNDHYEYIDNFGSLLELQAIVLQKAQI